MTSFRYDDSHSTPLFVTRCILLALGGVVLPLLSNGAGWWGGASGAAIALALAGSGELLGRYLFFVSVVPRHMAAPYLRLDGEAA